MIKTEFTELVGTKYPIIQAGMGPYSTNMLARAVANAGSLGTISGVGMAIGIPGIEQVLPGMAAEVFGKGTPEERMKAALRIAKEDIKGSDGVLAINCPVSAEFIQAAKRLITAALDAREEDSELEERFKVIITSAGNPTPWGEVITKSGAIWGHVCPSVYHAKKAEKAGADFVIASGHEGGMHISWEPVHSMVLLPAVVEAVNIPVVGAGGYCDGKSLVAALSLGGCGIQMGTRMIATQESDFVQMWKEYIVECGDRDSIATRAMFGPGRYLKSEASMDIARATIEQCPEMFLGEPVPMLRGKALQVELKGFEGLLTGDKQKSVFAGGEVAGRIWAIPTVKDLIDGIMSEAESIISKRLQEMLS
ncbi:MAG: nitronate monooxygenase [Halobacteriota archaeon]|nr:nitronate monooxygenase [Halobacteriota archaeon]